MALTEQELKVITLHAAIVMEEKGWTAHVRHDLKGRVCVLGALEDAMHTEDLASEHPIVGWLYERLTLAGVIPGEILRRWSEFPSARSRANVLADWSNESDGPTVVAALRAVASNQESDVLV